jgi:hypothetical protein
MNKGAWNNLSCQTTTISSDWQDVMKEEQFGLTNETCVQQTELLISHAIYLLCKRQYNDKRSACCGSKAGLEVQISFTVHRN